MENETFIYDNCYIYDYNTNSILKMKVTLGIKDIEKIIMDKFDGISSVKITPNGEAELEVDYTKFKEKTAISSQAVTKDYPQKTIKIPDTPIPTKEKNEEEVAQGTMVSGGIQRNIQHIG